MAGIASNGNTIGALRSLEGKVAWVTGAGTGIGQAGAVCLARAGMEVVLSGRRKEKLAETEDMIRGLGKAPIIEELDVADADQVAAVAAKIEERFSRLDVAVFSAGINVKNRSWGEVDTEGWDSVVDIDLNGAFYCCRSVLPIMRRQKEGLIINVSSLAGVRVSKMTGPAYTAAKHGMVAMNESINMEEAVNGIRACALCPGEVATPILDNRPVKVTDEEKAVMLQGEDLGETILFLAQLDTRVCVNQLVISPTANRMYTAGVT
ncbi:SDR family oxidoreductase [Sneathiella litorea]|uniref:SDR family NAD(P)-dependent oxidoreductase n=1 Tax=Sneathiella litorea TaxID=2606216 RepID=A0A6L8WB74_9PROT|nr:SDR family NAD(P)-dependent oxidoreductase [Sneathiella litorea]MZR31710.1 SDR family NAD(P)-dependent oxidoreductase [Sneathiella litorea]